MLGVACPLPCFKWQLCASEEQEIGIILKAHKRFASAGNDRRKVLTIFMMMLGYHFLRPLFVLLQRYSTV